MSRHISTLTVKEGAGLWDAVMPLPYAYKPFNGVAHRFKAMGDTPERFVFMSGCERLGVQFDGKLWADSDMVPMELDQEKIKAYLDSIGITLEDSDDEDEEYNPEGDEFGRIGMPGPSYFKYGNHFGIKKNNNKHGI